MRNVKCGVIVIIGIIAGYYSAYKYRYYLFLFFISALVPYHIITELSYNILTPDFPLSIPEKVLNKIKFFKFFCADILLFLFSLILSTSAWITLIS